MWRTNKGLPRGAVVALFLGLSACGASTTPPVRAEFGPANMEDGAATVPPGGWILYCLKNRQDISCQTAARRQAIWRDINAAQRLISTLPALSDAEKPSAVDEWVVASSNGGDCDDLALAARQYLLDRGWPAQAVRLATAWTEDGQYHALVTVDVPERGRVVTYALDNRFYRVHHWQELTRYGYNWDKRQAPEGGGWVRITASAGATAEPRLRLATLNR